MIDALKRKLLEYATELQTTKDRLASTNGELEVEKREHQLTTTKLSTLLRKRNAAALAAPTHDDGVLHQQIGLLQQQLRCSQEQLTNTAQQYEKLRQLTLEGFRMQRLADKQNEQPPTPSLPSLPMPTNSQPPPPTPPTPLQMQMLPPQPTASDVKPPTSISPPNDTMDAPTVSASPPPKRAPPPAVLEALRMALQPQTQPSSATAQCQQMWRSHSNNAQPRVGLPRSRSDLAALSDVAAAAATGGNLASGFLARPPGIPMSRSMSVGTDLLTKLKATTPGSKGPPLGGMTSLLTASAAVAAVGPACATPSTTAGDVASLCHQGIPSSPQQNSKVPFGYAFGAICVEPPKRQRTVTSVLSPRIG